MGYNSDIGEWWSNRSNSKASRHPPTHFNGAYYGGKRRENKRTKKYLSVAQLRWKKEDLREWLDKNGYDDVEIKSVNIQSSWYFSFEPDKTKEIMREINEQKSNIDEIKRAKENGNEKAKKVLNRFPELQD